MATDFFERQSVARRNTKWLVVMFALAVISIVGATFIATVVLVGTAGGDVPLELPIGASLAALAMIGGGSAFKIAQLSGGGTVLAERLNGRRVYPNSTHPVDRRLLNVVEEMALASGVPVPPVFMLAEERGIPTAATMAVGDGANDLDMIRAAGLGVALHAKPHVAAEADVRIDHADLTALLYLQGYTDEDIVR